MTNESASPSAKAHWASPELRALVRPFAIFAEEAAIEDAAPRRTLLARILFTQLMLGVAVSFITAGRLTFRLTFGTFIAWAMVPVIQSAIVLITHALGRTRMARVKAVSLYMVGNAPLLLFMVACAGVLLFAPDVRAAFNALLRTLMLPLALLGSLFYGWFLSYAYYRSGLGFRRGKSFALLAVDIFLKVGLVLAWYMAIDNIIPQIFGARP